MPLVSCVINGQYQTQLSVEDRAIHYADGLFETMLLKHKKIPLWSQHYMRLTRGCKVLGLHTPDEKTLLDDLQLLSQQLGQGEYIVKLIVSRGAAGRGIFWDKNIPVTRLCLAYDGVKIKRDDQKKMMICHTRLLMNQTLGGLKHLNRLLYVLAGSELKTGFSEGVLLNDKGELIECIHHNLFFVKDQVLITAPIVDCGVAGIMRQKVLDKAKEWGITISMKAIVASELESMDECFISNAVFGVEAVQSIDSVVFKSDIFSQKMQKSLTIK